ncbi:MAG: hypothetical protein OXH59_19315 [Rhodospirillaceae bacterium]|nr:hypothetical protein [Rhodospirillaceae bacterium]
MTTKIEIGLTPHEERTIKEIISDAASRKGKKILEIGPCDVIVGGETIISIKCSF